MIQEFELDLDKLALGSYQKSYTNKKGETVIKNMVKVKSVFLDEPTILKTGVSKTGKAWTLAKTAFFELKDVKGNDGKSINVGDAIGFLNDEPKAAPQQPAAEKNTNDIPF